MYPVTAVHEDTHFYIDNAPPREVLQVLDCLSRDEPLTPTAISQYVLMNTGYQMQRDVTYAPRRLYDLGFAKQVPHDGYTAYLVTDTGVRLRQLLALDPSLAGDLLHYAHYTRFDGHPATRKLFWSYRVCCDRVWSQRCLLPRDRLASEVLALIREQFSTITFEARIGARFDATAVGRCYTWLAELTPPAFTKPTGILKPRLVTRHELVLLSLDHIYRSRAYRYGDLMILDDTLLNDIAGVFFLDADCARDLISLASRVTRFLKLDSTLAGPAVALLKPYTIDSI